MRYLLLTYLLLTSACALHAQDLSLYQYKRYEKEGKLLPYRLLQPAVIESGKKYPLVIFLHGAFEKGVDNEKQLALGARFFLRDSVRERYPAFVMFPQCPENDAWAYFENKLDFTTGTYTDWKFPFREQPNAITGTLLACMEEILKNEAIDPSRVYVAGVSQGAMGVLDMIARKPDLFAGALAICGAGEPTTARLFAGKTAVWLFHGDEDKVVPIEFSRQLYRRLKRADAVVRYSEYKGVEHNSWNQAFAEPDLLRWLFAQHKNN